MFPGGKKKRGKRTRKKWRTWGTVGDEEEDKGGQDLKWPREVEL